MFPILVPDAPMMAPWGGNIRIMVIGTFRFRPYDLHMRSNFVQRLIICLLAVATIASCDRSAEELSIRGHTMGTNWSVKVADCSAAHCTNLQAVIEERLTSLNNNLSHFRQDAEVARFNRWNDTGWMPISQDTATVVAYAQQVSELSDGAFDITLAPAIDAWGFGTEATFDTPASTTLRNARLHSGYQKLRLRSDSRALRKLDPLVRINLSAIAKGYAVDQLAYLLETRGLNRYLIEIGGEIRTAGTRSDGQPWRIGIQPPEGDMQIEYVVTPGDAAIATSGDYRNYYLTDDRRISHTIDPATARPVVNRIASVSVIAPDAMQADALATAFMVMGRDKATRFAQQHGIAMLLLIRNGHNIEPIVSAAFEPYLLNN